jgi:PAS domain S-box-containing protein
LLAIVEDITDRKRAESTLALTQFAVDHAGDLIFWIGRDARILYVNEAAAQRLGYNREELCTMTIADIDPNYQADVWPRHWEELRLQKKLRFESCHRTKNGEFYPAEIVSTYVSFEGQEYNFAFTRDISERKAAEEALRASEERLSKAFRSSPYPIVITDLESGTCLDVNDAALAAFGFTRDEVIGQTTSVLGIWPHPQARQEFIERLTTQGGIRNIEVLFESKRGEVRRFLASTEVIVLNGKQCLVTIATDITEQKRVEEALRRSELAVRQAFEERERLSQDLHDNLLQSLYAVGMGLELTKQRIQRISRTNAKRLEQSVGQLNNVIREVRSFISQAQAPVVFEQTVGDTLRALAGSFMATGAGEIVVTVDGEVSLRLSPEQRIHVLAVAKEALSNSIRHTKAEKRMVRLRRHGNKIRLEVIDNGQGFSPAHRHTQGMGLQNMRARARKLGGRIVIRSAPKKGTTVTLTIPSR